MNTLTDTANASNTHSQPSHGGHGGHVHEHGNSSGSGSTDDGIIHDFDAMAQQYATNPIFREVSDKIVSAVLDAYAFNKDETRMLDYACGPGLIAEALVPHTKQIIGVDSSQMMVGQFNRRAEVQGIPSEKMRAIYADLTLEEEAGGVLDNERFDIVLCSMAYHHLKDINSATRILASFLKPGGTLLVVDLTKDKRQSLLLVLGSALMSSSTSTTTADGQTRKPETAEHGHEHEHEHQYGQGQEGHHQHHHAVTRSGAYDEASLQPVFEGAGLETFTFTSDLRLVKGETELNMCIAKGTKPQSAASK